MDIISALVLNVVLFAVGMLVLFYVIRAAVRGGIALADGDRERRVVDREANERMAEREREAQQRAAERQRDLAGGAAASGMQTREGSQP